MTDPDLTWDPTSTVFEEQEEAMVDWKGDLIGPDTTARGPSLVINSVCTSTCEDAADIASDDNFADVLLSNVHVSQMNVSSTATIRDTD